MWLFLYGKNGAGTKIRIRDLLITKRIYTTYYQSTPTPTAPSKYIQLFVLYVFLVYFSKEAALLVPPSYFELRVLKPY
jgi:hypothetical protein